MQAQPTHCHGCATHCVLGHAAKHCLERCMLLLSHHDAAGDTLPHGLCSCTMLPCAWTSAPTDLHCGALWVPTGNSDGELVLVHLGRGIISEDILRQVHLPVKRQKGGAFQDLQSMGAVASSIMQQPSVRQAVTQGLLKWQVWQTGACRNCRIAGGANVSHKIKAQTHHVYVTPLHIVSMLIMKEP